MSDLTKIVAEGFELIASDLDKTRESVDNASLPVLRELGEIKAMLADLLAANSHMRDDDETYRATTNERLAKLERRALANGAGYGAAE